MSFPSLGRRSPLLLPLLAIAFAAACGSSVTPSPSPSSVPTPTKTPSPSPTGTPTPPAVTYTSARSSAIDRGHERRRLYQPTAHLGELPQVVVETDGKIYWPDFNNGGATQPIIQPIAMRDVGAAGAEQILAAIQAAGLDQDGLNCGISADTGASVFTVEIDGIEYVSRFAGGGPGGPGNPGASPAASSDPCTTVQAAALDLVARLVDPTETFGADSAPVTRLSPTAYRLWVAPVDTTLASVAWPLSTPLATFGTPATPDFGVTGLRSGIVLGADAQTLRSALEQVQPGAGFTSDGTRYQFWIRALFPYEVG